MQAYREGSKRLILFEDVDMYTPIKRNVAGQKQLLPCIIRAANRKTLREIHQEIRAAQVQDVANQLRTSLAIWGFLIHPFINGGRSWLNIVRTPSQAVGISQLKKKKSVASSVSWK